MTKILLGTILVLLLSFPVSAEEMTAPEVPYLGLDIMPQNTGSFGEGLWELLLNSMKLVQPELKKTIRVSSGMIGTALLCLILSLLTERMHTTMSIAGTIAITTILLKNTNSMLSCATDAVRDICEYGKLLCPVMTMTMAAQGGICTSTALYTGTMVFIAVLSMMIANVLVPLTYILVR